ncbi:Short-chain dehydrogenase/reductase SDR - like 7 [Theobroma cacao]|nr:Short-chain dehydrogenase/reductase SDR - like 7 [Theobroma cacao]
MAETCNFLAAKRYAVVTGANKGIGLEICRQLASKGVMVVLTARDENRGLEAVEKLKESGVSDNVVFHQLDVTDPVSIASLADFIGTQFGKLDILVNNAAIPGVIMNYDSFARAVERFGDWPTGDQVWNEIITAQTYELAEECLKTNYYGMKRMVEALAPFLRLSDSARIVNVTSYLGVLQLMSNEWAKGVLSDVESLTEERVEEVLNVFLKDFKEGRMKSKGWPTYIGPTAYSVSKAAMNAYTRVLAKKYPSFWVICVAPGFAKTDITGGTGYSTAAEGAENVVFGLGSSHPRHEKDSGNVLVSPYRYAVVTGANKGIGLEICRQLASKGVMVVLTARDEKRAMNAYTRILARRYPKFSINCVCPGFVKTDLNFNTGKLTVEEGAATPVKYAVVTGANKGIGLEICKQLACKGITVVLTARDEKRGLEALENLKHSAEECLKTNYYGAIRTAEALIPLLQLSDLPRIVNVSSSVVMLKHTTGERLKGILTGFTTEEKLNDFLTEYLKDFKEGLLESKGWPTAFSAYTVSKVAMNAHTRILAKKYPNFCINCVCPGFVKTDINFNTGKLTVEEGAASPVKIALLPNGGPSGLFFNRNEPASFDSDN